MKELRLELKNEDGQVDTFVQDFIPMKRLLEWYENQSLIEEGEIKPGVDVIVKKIEFVASLFDDERVTPERILSGLDSRQFEEKIHGLINQVVLGETDPKETGKLSQHKKY
ncbi:phage tail assembly chaperone G [Aerococcus kribbianus]|uniref:Phage protein n=1 Tax=Aerococcus kribbianus TaxID=2999064 RepID=A0A9X3JFM6_9LACT|nr:MULTISPECIES: hypothetical protein [unclassified Aerococcus]MCZ0717829.1 hypothetical protein [Aerococcus sp. YH-aer221]MCZ0726116.1 hypothetical protein [Aerococcus sp. YH-aer222]